MATKYSGTFAREFGLEMPIPKKRSRHANAKLSGPKTVAEVETFIAMLRAACDDLNIYSRLEKLLCMSDKKRRAVVHAWVSDLLIAEAPSESVQAIACLLDDKVAEKAYEVIFECRRKGG